MENITESSTAILMDDGSKYNVNQSVINNCSFQIAQVNKSETNLTTVIDQLKNGTVMIADNYYHNQTISFTYGFDHLLVPWWPDHDFFILVWISEKNLTTLMAYTVLICVANWLVHNITGRGWCHGVIYYGSNANTHEMNGANRDWIGWATDWTKYIYYYISTSPGLQMISVNHTVGQWLANNSEYPSNTVSGFMNQIFYEEDHTGNPNTWTAGVEAYNVEGNITTKNNPSNAIVISSNRYDAMAGQCPGDSGAGAGIVLAIAKYMKDNNITPKYNITFLEDTGEEYAFRGAWHYNHNHPPSQYNIIRWIGFDQLGFKQESGPLELSARCNNICNNYDTDRSILRAIANDSNLGYAFDTEEAKPGTGVSEDVAWLTRPNCKTILFEKNNSWLYHHETGMNFVEGDSMKNMNRTELNVTLNFSWAVMKYYTVNPDCHFHSVSYEAVNTTGGTAPDSIKATFKVKSVLPSDLVRVNASLYNASTHLPVPNAYQVLDFEIDKTGVERNITLTMPSDVKEGDYYIKLDVYNSTARINRTLGYTNYSNDTKTSPTFHLNKYRTLGDIRIGTANTTVHNIIRGSRYTTAEDAVVHNITAYVKGVSPGGPTYQCMIYRLSDGYRMGYSNQVVCNDTGWVTFNFSSEPVLTQDTQYILSIWGNNENAIVYSTPVYSANGYCNESYTFNDTPPQTICWDFTMAFQQYSLFCWYTADIPYITNVTASPHIVGFGYNV
ncbi:MAG: M28 family peptidase, partial [Thermoplasmata archaeon]|nr:M28 family peptidase [Thermoplasmata archaeon]